MKLPKLVLKKHVHQVPKVSPSPRSSKRSTAAASEPPVARRSAGRKSHSAPSNDSDSQEGYSSGSSGGSTLLSCSSAASSFSRRSHTSSWQSSMQSSDASTPSAARALSSKRQLKQAPMRATQYSAYARKMRGTTRRTSKLARTNSSVNFDDADEFFDKSDSTVGTGSGSSLTSANIGGCIKRGSDDERDDEDADYPEAGRQPYRSTIPTGRRMTQTELGQRKLMQEMEANLIATQQGKLPHQADSGAGVRKTVGVAAAASEKLSPRNARTSGGTDKGAAAKTSSRCRSSLEPVVPISGTHKDKGHGAPELTATSTTAPALRDRNSRNWQRKSGSRGKASPMSTSEKKLSGLFAWKHKFLRSSRKSSEGSTSTSRGTTSPSSTSNSKMPLTTSTLTLLKRGRNTGERRSSAGSAHNGADTARVGGSLSSSEVSRSQALAAVGAKSASSATGVSAATTVSFNASMPVVKGNVHRLDNNQMSKSSASRHKASKTAHSKSTSAAGAAPHALGSSHSLVSSSGYRSFMDLFASTDFGFGKYNGDAVETRSNASRRSHRHAAAPTASSAASSRSIYEMLFRNDSGHSCAQHSTSTDKKHKARHARPAKAGTGSSHNKKNRGPARQASHGLLVRSSESPASDESGVETSLYCSDGRLSTGSSTDNGNRSDGWSRGNCSRRKPHRSLPGSGRKSGTAGAQAAAAANDDGCQILTPADGLGHYFGSLFNGEVISIPAAPALTALHSGPSATPPELSCLSTPGSGPLSVQQGSSNEEDRRSSVLRVRSVCAASPLSTTQPPLPHQQRSVPSPIPIPLSHPYPCTTVVVASAGSGAAAAGSAGDDTKTRANMLRPARHRQHQSSLGQTPLSVQEANPNTDASASVAAAAATASAPLAAAGVSNSNNPAAHAAGGTVAGNQHKAANGRSTANSNSSPSPACDEFATPSSSTPAASAAVSSVPPLTGSNQSDLEGVSFPLVSLENDSASQRQATSCDHQLRHTHHHRSDVGNAATEEDVSSRQSTHRNTSLLSVTDGFRLRRHASGGSISGNSRHHPNRECSEDPQKDSKNGGGSRSSNGRRGGSPAAAVEGSHEQYHSPITPKHAHSSSTSLQPMLSSTESKNYRGGNIIDGSGSTAGNSFSASIAPLQGSGGMRPTRADSRDFQLWQNREGSTSAAGLARQSSHESFRRHRSESGGRKSRSHHRRAHRHSSALNSRCDGSFSFSSESFLDGKARGQLAKAAAASNAASNSVEHRRVVSAQSFNNNPNSSSGGGGDVNKDSASTKRHQSRDHRSTSPGGSQHYHHRSNKKGASSSGTVAPHQRRHHKEGDRDERSSRRHHHHHHHSTVNCSAEVETFESLGSPRRRRNRGDQHGSMQMPSSASVSLVIGLDEVLPHKPMLPRNASLSTASSAAASSRHSSASSSEHLDESVGRNSVRCLCKMAAKARDVSNSSSCELDALGSTWVGNSNRNSHHHSSSKHDSSYHAHSKVMPQTSAERNANSMAPTGSGLPLARAQHNNSSVLSTASTLHFPCVTQSNGSGFTSNTNSGTHAMKLPSFKPSMMAESSSSNDVSTDRTANSGGSRQQQHPQQYNGSDGGPVHLQRMPLAVSREGSSNYFKGSRNFALQPTRPLQGSSGNGRSSRNTATCNNNNDGGGGGGEKDGSSSSSAGDRVLSSAECWKGAGERAHVGSSSNSGGGATLLLAQRQHSSSGTNSVESTEVPTTTFVGEGGVRQSITSALLVQSRDSSTKRRRPAAESFTPWSVDMSRFDKLREQHSTSTAAAE
ncbi:hypothetical protein ABL78_7106 [Leptomonas seymouri]|uniref:Uncharacterized protein n=1 Tax=Leptomonas seymouri TaxID=5684 RepID=A0A0N0P390_LEPSE|nr:hypothetical protein ABL78_7106 [Leptomonas seymouri]|eukprot:KPI83856.1 hypothetical protein ABL78_7106 [Leptomonas seymouri]